MCTALYLLLGRLMLLAEGCRGSISEVSWIICLCMSWMWLDFHSLSPSDEIAFFVSFYNEQKLIKRYSLREKVNAQHQTYALGIKEVPLYISLFSIWESICRCLKNLNLWEELFPHKYLSMVKSQIWYRVEVWNILMKDNYFVTFHI